MDAESLAPLPRGPDRAGRGEVQLALERLGEVPLAPGHIRAAVHDPGRDRAPAVAEGDPGAARQRLVRHAHGARGKRAAAAQVVSVEAGAVPRRASGAIAVHPQAAASEAKAQLVAPE